MCQTGPLPAKASPCLLALVTIRPCLLVLGMQVLTEAPLTGMSPGAGVIGEQALSDIAGFVRGQRIQKKPVALVSMASAATVLVTALGVYLLNVHPHVASWG